MGIKVPPKPADIRPPAIVQNPRAVPTPEPTGTIPKGGDPAPLIKNDPAKK